MRDNVNDNVLDKDKDEDGSMRRESGTMREGERRMSLRLNAIIINDKGVSAREFPLIPVPFATGTVISNLRR